MKRHWRIFFATCLIGTSVVLYALHYLIFKDAYHIFFYLLSDIAFVPISVLLVTLVLSEIFESKQKEMLMHKLNMVLGTFFSEVGNPLLKLLDSLKQDNPALHEKLLIRQEWTSSKFKTIRETIRQYPFNVRAEKTDLAKLRDFLGQKNNFCSCCLKIQTCLNMIK